MGFLVLLFVHLNAAVPNHLQSDETEIINLFKNESSTRWNEYVKFADTLQGSIRTKIFHDGKLVDDGGGIIKRLGSSVLSIQGATDKPSNKVYGVNSDYGFALDKSAKEEKWILIGSEKLPLSSSVIKNEIKDARVIFHSLLFAYLNDFSELTTSKNFKIIHAERVSGGNLVKITFENRHSPDDDKSNELSLFPYNPVQSGFIVFDVDHHWTLRAGELELLFKAETSGHMSVEVEIGAYHGNYPIPKRIVEIQNLEFKSPRAIKQKLQMRIERNYDLGVSTPSYRDFTLSAFNLPEPPWVTQNTADSVGTAPWFTYLAASGIVCLTIAWFMKRKRSRVATI